MHVLFAPDWRNGVPYQRLLAEALERRGVRVTFLEGYKRVMPLTRLMRQQACDILHLHWPEAYYPKKEDEWDWFRRLRFAMDVRGATRRCKLATTAHNLHAHNRAAEPFAQRNTGAAHQRAGVVFAHSEVAREQLIAKFSLDAEKVRVIPHGDLSVTLGTPAPMMEARAQLGLGPEKLVLMFGAVEPYKGQEEVIGWWKGHQPDAVLAIVGQPITEDYARHIGAAIGGDPKVLTRFAWLPDELLRLWLSAADAAVFNYRSIFTSGAANLARSWGLPVLLPARLETVVLGEPSAYVRRFHDLREDFGRELRGILQTAPDFAAASGWRAACSWDEVARLTCEGYLFAREEVRKQAG